MWNLLSTEHCDWLKQNSNKTCATHLCSRHFAGHRRCRHSETKPHESGHIIFLALMLYYNCLFAHLSRDWVPLRQGPALVTIYSLFFLVSSEICGVRGQALFIQLFKQGYYMPPGDSMASLKSLGWLAKELGLQFNLLNSVFCHLWLDKDKVGSVTLSYRSPASSELRAGVGSWIRRD